MKWTIRCTCGGVKTKMESAMQLIAPGEPMPQDIKGKDAIRKLAGQYPGTSLASHLLAVVKKNGRFCYYVEATEKGELKDMRDLLTGRRMY